MEEVDKGVDEEVKKRKLDDLNLPINPPKLIKIEEFDDSMIEEGRKIYYRDFFPYDLMVEWLSYGQKEGAKLNLTNIDINYLSKREISLTLANDIYMRYKSVNDKDEFRKLLLNYNPVKIDIGPVYNCSPQLKDHISSAFTPVQRELIFDIDLTDYDEIRTCCKESNVCTKCWTYITIASKILYETLRNTFGYKDIFFAFSGRRGIHCYVCDQSALNLTDEQRSSIINYLSINFTNDEVPSVFKDQHHHPYISECYQLLVTYFSSFILDHSGMNILSNETMKAKFFSFFPKNDQSNIKDMINENIGNGERIMEIFNDYLFQLNSSRDKNLRLSYYPMRATLYAIVFYFTYMRLDSNVSRKRIHLLKSPFCIHPKTNKLCVILDYENIQQFDPSNVPRLQDIISNPDTIKPYYDLFKDRFIQPLYQRLIKH